MAAFSFLRGCRLSLDSRSGGPQVTNVVPPRRPFALPALDGVQVFERGELGTQVTSTAAMHSKLRQLEVRLCEEPAHRRLPARDRAGIYFRSLLATFADLIRPFG